MNTERDYLLYFASKDSEPSKIKLNKLVYLANGLAISSNQEFAHIDWEKGKYGPWSRPLTDLATEIISKADTTHYEPRLSVDKHILLGCIWMEYGQHTASYLSSMVHTDIYESKISEEAYSPADIIADANRLRLRSLLAKHGPRVVKEFQKNLAESENSTVVIEETHLPGDTHEEAILKEDEAEIVVRERQEGDRIVYY